MFLIITLLYKSFKSEVANLPPSNGTNGRSSGGRTGRTSGRGLTPTQQREQQRQDSLLSEAARIVGLSSEGAPGEDGPRGPNYNLLLGRKGVGRVEKVGNELIVYGKVAGSNLSEDELKRIPLQNKELAAEIIANFLSEDKTYNPRNSGRMTADQAYENYQQSRQK